MHISDTKRMKPIPEEYRLPNGSFNPFHYDLHNMGQDIGKDLMLMYCNHPNQECPYLILVDTKTGERIKLDIKQ